jgi:hypothetical protein
MPQRRRWRHTVTRSLNGVSTGVDQGALAHTRTLEDVGYVLLLGEEHVFRGATNGNTEKVVKCAKVLKGELSRESHDGF